jgi:5-(carboxyamino)imidazole ribonucleotide synthase
MVKTVGVIGGGQLAWMMGGAAQKLGIDLMIQTPGEHDPAVAIAIHTIFAPVADAVATAELASRCEVITFENEFVDLPGLQQLANQGVKFYPRLKSLDPVLDKLDQRSFYQAAGIPIPKFAAIDAGAALESPWGYPVVLKARRLGYDGYGTIICKTAEELAVALKTGGKPSSSPSQNNIPWLIEEFIPFEKELAVMAARSVSGETAIYPVVESQQENQVCRRVFVLDEWDAAVQDQVKAIAHTLLEKLDYVGILGIELFLTTDGRVLVNEIAPRTHNSGHYTLDACVTSQFEQQLRAVSGLPLGSTALTCPGAIMVNLLGFESAESLYIEKREHLGQIPRSHVYWYGKTQSRPGRKMGHVNVLLDEGQGRAEAAAIAQEIERIWYET